MVGEKENCKVAIQKKQKRTCFLFSLTHSLSTFFCTTPRAPTHFWLMQNTSSHTGLSVESGLVCVACVVHEKKKLQTCHKNTHKTKNARAFSRFFTHTLAFNIFFAPLPVHRHVHAHGNPYLHTRCFHLKVVSCVQHVWLMRKKIAKVKKFCFFFFCKHFCFFVFLLTFNALCTTPPCTHTLLVDAKHIYAYRALICVWFHVFHKRGW